MKVKKIHSNTFDPRFRDFNGEWVNTNTSTMHKILYHHRYGYTELHKVLESRQHSTVVCKETTYRLRTSSWCEIMCRVTFSHHTYIDNIIEKSHTQQREMVFFCAFRAQFKVDTRAVKCYAFTLWINFRVTSHLRKKKTKHIKLFPCPAFWLVGY